MSRQSRDTIHPPPDTGRPSSTGTARRGGRAAAGPSSRPHHSGGGGGGGGTTASSSTAEIPHQVSSTDTRSGHPSVPPYRNPSDFGLGTTSKRAGKQPESRDAAAGAQRLPQDGFRKADAASHNAAPVANMVTASQELRGIAHGGPQVAETSNVPAVPDAVDNSASAADSSATLAPVIEIEVATAAGTYDDLLTDEIREKTRKSFSKQIREDGAFQLGSQDLDDEIAATDPCNSDWDRNEAGEASDGEVFFVSRASENNNHQQKSKTPKRKTAAKPTDAKSPKRKERRVSAKHIMYEKLKTESLKAERDRAILKIRENWGMAASFWPEEHYPMGPHEGKDTKLQPRDVSGSILDATARLSVLTAGNVGLGHKYIKSAVAKREKQRKGSGGKLIVSDVEEAIAKCERKLAAQANKAALPQVPLAPTTPVSANNASARLLEQLSPIQDDADTVMYDIPEHHFSEKTVSPDPQNSLPSPAVSPQVAKQTLAAPQPAVSNTVSRAGLVLSPNNTWTEVSVYAELQWTKQAEEARESGKMLRMDFSIVE